MAALACRLFRQLKTSPLYSLTHLDKTVFLSSRHLHGPPKVNEYSEVPLYPPIPGHRTADEMEQAELRKHIRDLKTVEEKQYWVNRPKYYGWYSFIINQHEIPSDALDFVQFSTWTHVIDGLPECYSDPSLESAAAKTLKDVAPLVEQVILNETSYHEHKCHVLNDHIPKRDVNANWCYHPELEYHARFHEQKKKDALVKRIHEVVMNYLDGQVEHLNECTEDIEARNEAFWFRGGINPDKSMIKKREGTKKKRDELADKGVPNIQRLDDSFVNAPYERALQFKGKNLIQLRCDKPLPEFVDRDSDLATKSEVPVFPHDPRTLTYHAKCQHGTNIPGCWPEDENQHGVLAYTNRFNRFDWTSVGSKGVITDQVARKQIVAKSILTSFGWLLPQAVHLGFSPLTDLTYPLTTQTVVTDGRTWTYSAYQLNTCDLCTNNPGEHTHRNLAWVEEDKQLYDKVHDGKVEGFDPEVLLPLVKMYLMKPQERWYDMTPYLEGSGRVVDHPNNYQRQFLHGTMKHQYSNRPRHHKKPEIYMWEKIFVIDHNMMHVPNLARRNRWFQMCKISHLGKEHFHPEFKKYDEERQRYLPKGFREPWQRKRGMGRRYYRYLPKLKIPLEEDSGPFPNQRLPESTVDMVSDPARPRTKLKIGRREGK